MTTVAPPRHWTNSFRIHEDVPSTEDTQMNEEVEDSDHGHEHEDEDEVEVEEHAEEHAEEQQEYQESEYSESSEDDVAVDNNIQHDMDKLQSAFPGFRNQYRLIKRIGEGMSLP